MKFAVTGNIPTRDLSPSMRREWIEMPMLASLKSVRMSPSMRREWIEIEYNNS